MHLDVSTNPAYTLGTQTGSAINLSVGGVAGIELNVSDSGAYDLGIGAPNSIDLGVGVAVIHGVHYTGALTVTPSQNTQTLQTTGMVLDGDVVVDPIPSNYGLITWNGSALVIS